MRLCSRGDIVRGCATVLTRYRGPFDPFVDLLVDLLLGSGPKSAVVHVDALLDVGTTAGPATSGRSDHCQEHWA